MNPNPPPPGPPYQPYPVPPYPVPPHPYPYPYPPVYVPPPAPPPNPLAFDEPEPDRPRRRREPKGGGGTKGLIIALVVMTAVGLGWFGSVSVRSERDRARLVAIQEEIQSLNLHVKARVGYPPFKTDPTIRPPEHIPGSSEEVVRIHWAKYERAQEAEWLRKSAEYEARKCRPDVKPKYDLIRDLSEEYRRIRQRHPDWNVPEPPTPW